MDQDVKSQASKVAKEVDSKLDAKSTSIPDTKSTPIPDSKSTKTKAGIDKEKLATTVKTLQFGWFVGHFLTLISVFFFTLTYLKIGARIYWFWYDLAALGIVASFGILVYQLVKKVGFDVKTLIKDDNVHFLGLGIMFLILRPYIILPIIPFQLFSLFHVLSYSKAYLLPIFDQDENSKAYKVINGFIANNNSKSIQLACILEVCSLFFLLARVLLFRKRSLSPFLIYLVFMKLRYEKSVVTRNVFKFLELKIDGVVNNVNNPNVKSYWIKAKSGLRKVGDYKLVNDYTKEKTT